MKCEKCGSELRIGTEKVGVDKNNLPEYHRFSYCDNCKIKYDLDVNNKSKKRKDSTLSVWAAVLGIFTCTTFIGAIIGIVDLCKNKNDGKRHIGSWFAIIMCFLWMIVCISKIGDDNSNNSNEQKEQIEITGIATNEETEKKSSEVEEVSNTECEYADWKVKYISHEIGKDYADNEVLIVYFEFTNNSDKNKSFAYAFSDVAFQNGVELEPTFWETNEETKNAGKEIQPGTTIKVATTYGISDKETPVTVELSPFNIWSDKVLMSLELEIK